MADAQRAGVTVLVVDDDAPIREALRVLLEDEGYTVLEAGTGARCLEIVRATPSRMVVLLDNLLPDTDGISLLKGLSRDRGLLKRHAFILMSAQHLSTRLALLRYLSRLSVPRLQKPFDIDDVAALVAEACRRLR